MCGIAGVWSFRAENADALRAAAGRMAGRLLHRGPDDAGSWVDPSAGIAFGFRRLAIIDLSAAGAQPMTSAGGRYTIVFNGEIYNHLRLRSGLEADGLAPAWRGHSDTEVLLACIEAWGLQETIRRCIGMFAFALWDGRERRLSLVRDRVGVKPMYFAMSAERILFGSELKALRAHPDFDASIDETAARLYARLGYVPAPWSIYRGARKLEPGTILTVAADGQFETRRYWKAGAEVRFEGSEAEALERLEELLSDAVALRMIADVPLGVFLSGGVDSSLVAALMQRPSSGPIHTFTIGFEDTRFDEAGHAREVARRLGSDHDELYVRDADALAIVPLLPDVFDEPFADSSALPTYLVSRLARRSATVALSGDGGDETFLGYHRHFLGARLHRRIRAVPRFARPAAGRALRLLRRTKSLGEALVEDDALDTYLRGMSTGVHLGEDPARRLLEEAAGDGSLDPVERIGLADFSSYLPDQVLVKVDRASMAVSLEVRSPFLDHRVVELAWSLPLRMKIREDRGKWITRQLLRKYLPDEHVDRGKQGFGLPVAEWLRGPLRPWVEDLLSGVRDDPFAATRVREAWRRHLAGEDLQNDLWTVLMFQAWMRR